MDLLSFELEMCTHQKAALPLSKTTLSSMAVQIDPENKKRALYTRCKILRSGILQSYGHITRCRLCAMVFSALVFVHVH